MRGGWVERGTVVIRLGRAHFAFYRGYLDGLEVGDLAARYLTSQLPPSSATARPDLRLAKSAVHWIRGQLLVLARRSLAPADVRLLALSPVLLLVDYGRQGPGLDDFRQEHDADGMYSEAELIDLYQQAHGEHSAAADRRAARNHRLRQRQQQALNQLEAVTSADPQPADRVDGWLDPVLARRLHAVGVDHLADLVALIARHGYRWYRKVPRIGIQAALQIGRWLQHEAVRTNAGLQPAGRPFDPPRTLAPAPPPAARTAIVPLEYFCIPTALSSTPHDAGNAAQPVADADSAGAAAPRDDVAAIQRWLALKPVRGHAGRAYRKEAERLLLWAVLERGKILNALNVEDCTAYREFLGLIGRVDDDVWLARFRMPQSAWIGAPGAARDSRFWRPFQGPLGAASQRQAVTILKGMLAWLNAQGYLARNPMQKIRLPARTKVANSTARTLSQAEWLAIVSHLNQQPASAAHDRLRCVLALAAVAGLKLAELAALRRGHARPALPSSVQGGAWTLHVPQTDGGVRLIPLDDVVLAELQRYFTRRGCADFASAPADTPVIAALPARIPATGTGRQTVPSAQAGAEAQATAAAALTIDRIHRIIKRLFEDVAASRQADDPALAARLRCGSADWLRRSAGSRFTLESSSKHPMQPLARTNA